MGAGLIQRKLLIKHSPIKGYGVFAGEDFQVNDVIEECYTLTLPKDTTLLSDYLFENGKGLALLLGFGSIYNHASDPSVGFFYDEKRSVTVVIAKKCINRGEEIFVSYGSSWFHDRGYEEKIPSVKINRFLPFLAAIARFTLILGAMFGIVLLIR